MTSIRVPIVVALGVLAAASYGQDLSKAEMSLDDVAVSWHAGQGMSIDYHGLPVFVPYSAQHTVHDAGWAQAFYSSREGAARGRLEQAGDARTLVISDETEHFSFTKTVRLEPGGQIVIEHEFGQRGLEDAHLQLGMRPAVPWLDGAAYRVVTQEGEESGRMTYGRGDRRVLWSRMTEMSFGSLFGTWTLSSTHGMTLYDDRDKGSFFLGWDQELADGETYRERIEIALEPATRVIEGVRVADFAWEDEVRDGSASVRMSLASAEGGPDAVSLRLTAMRAEEEVAEVQETAPLQADPRQVELTLALPEPGDYGLRLAVLSAAEEELFRQLLTTKVVPLMRFVPSLSLYTHETEAELLITLNERPDAEELMAELTGTALGGRREVAVEGEETVVPIDLSGVPDGMHEVQCRLMGDGRLIAVGRASFAKAPPKSNEVKIDYRSRGLIVNGKPFFPFGFYTHRGQFYDQQEPQYVLRLEGAFGFNMICVYHNFPDEFRREQRPVIADFVDHAEAVGMHMHYDVRQITDREPSEEVDATLSEEVEAFRDAPGLLTWYLSDEPAGRGNPPERYVHHNRHVKRLDPYHPTTMVFCVPSKAHQYAGGMDILMVDPYPIPNGPVTRVADTVDLVDNATGGTMPIWCVPQAFGGGEGWAREPTWQEQRCMTYMAIAHGATGIQYFIRRPPHNNPFVDGMWAECRKLAREIRQLTPALLSHEPGPAVESIDGDGDLHLAARLHNGQAYVVCVNAAHEPKSIRLQCSAAPVEASAEVMFENRAVPVSENGVLEDMIDALGVRIYRYRVGEVEVGPVTLDPQSLVRNGGFEEATNPGYPDACRVSYSAQTGASWGTDPLEAVEGTHSLYIRAPADGKGLTVTTFPASLAAGSYELSLYLKADRPMQAFVGASGWRTWEETPSMTVDVTEQWARQAMRIELPVDERRVHVSVRPENRGVLWVDAVQMVPMERVRP